METLRIAFVGGGITSLCLAHGLSRKHPQWELKIFEASAALRDESAGIGLGSNAQDALQLISPSLRQALDEAGGVRMEPSARIMIGTGPDSGRHVGDINSAVAQITVHRGSFLRALHRRIPDGILQTGKRLTAVNHPTDGPLTLHFEDGTTYEADALIGCDGITSMTRRLILGADHPAASPVYGNGRVHRAVIPLDTAVGVFGEDYCKLKSQCGWVGDDGFLLTDIIDEGNQMQLVAGWSRGEPWTHPAPWVEWSKDSLKADLEGWGAIGKGMTKIFMDEPKLYAAGSRTHLDTPIYFKGNICVAGDAAQSFPPFQGAGAGQAIEDALMLSTVLGTCSAKRDILHAFEVYDAMRRPRRSNIAASSQKAALLMTGKAPGIGMDPHLIANELRNWASNIYDYDLDAAQAEGLERMGQP